MLRSARCTVIVLLQKSTLRHVFQPLPFGLSPVLNFFALVFYCFLVEVAVFFKDYRTYVQRLSAVDVITTWKKT